MNTNKQSGNETLDGVNIDDIISEVNLLTNEGIQFNETTNILGLVNQTLKNKEIILKELSGKLEIIPNEIENISDEDFFNYLIVFLKTKKNINSAEIQKLENSYSNSIVNKNRAIFRLKVESNISVENKGKIGKETLAFIEEKIENRKQSNVILNYLNKYPTQNKNILNLLNKCENIEKLVKLIESINVDEKDLVKFNEFINIVNITKFAKFIDLYNGYDFYKLININSFSDLINKVDKLDKLIYFIFNAHNINDLINFINEIEDIDKIITILNSRHLIIKILSIIARCKIENFSRFINLIDKNIIHEFKLMLDGINIDRIIYLIENININNFSKLLNNIRHTANLIKLINNMTVKDFIYLIENININNFSKLINESDSDKIYQFISNNIKTMYSIVNSIKDINKLIIIIRKVEIKKLIIVINRYYTWAVISTINDYKYDVIIESWNKSVLLPNVISRLFHNGKEKEIK